jgi:hypothetical protein
MERSVRRAGTLTCQARRQPIMTERIGRGTLTGRWEPRRGACPNIRGGITLERALPAKTKLWLTGWTKSIAGGPVRVALG